MKRFNPVLERSALFDGIAIEDLGAMLGCIGGHTINVAKGQSVYREGDPATHVGMVLSGAVRLVREDFYGNRSIVAHICAFHNRIIHNLLRLVAVKNLVFDQKIQVTSKRTTREKLMAFLLNQAKLHGNNSFTIPYDRQELADYLEVDRSGLSAEISKLRREGVLESEKNHFTLL